MMLADLLKNVAPGLATAVMGPAGGMVVKAIAEKLGVDPTEAAVEAHLQANPQDAVKLAEIKLEELKADHANTADARKMNAEIQLSAASSFLAKNTAYIIDFVIVGATIIMTWMIFFKGVPDANKELAYMAFGSLLTLCGTVVNFHRGSSQGSKDKGDEVKNLKGLVK
jgi:hypothetical protein